MARADFITSLVLIVFGLGVVEESWRMPRFTEYGSSIWSAPGIVPGLIGLALTVMGIVLMSRARRALAAGQVSADPDGDETMTKDDRVRVGIAFGFCLLFAGVLVGRVPFMAAAFLFMLTFMLVFDIQANPGILSDRPRLAKRVAMSLAISAVAAFGIATIFQDVFFVRLP